MGIFYAVCPHLLFEHPFGVWEISHLPKIGVRHLLFQPPLQLEMSFHKCDLVSTNRRCHVRVHFEREYYEEDDAMKNTG